MACTFEVILSGEDKAYLTDVANLALDEIERLDEQLSCYDPRSEVSYLNYEAANGPVIVEPGLFSLLRLAGQIGEDTGRAFDVTTGPLIDLWRRAEKTGTEPDMQAIRHALAKVSVSHIVMDERTNSVGFDTEGVGINLGAIGKGFAVRNAARVLREYGVQSALVSAGRSTICAIGDRAPGERGWNIGIRHPVKLDERVATVNLRDRAMATSGGVAQRDEKVEERFEHIIDPATGMPARPSTVSVTVLADDAAAADALSTAFYLRDIELAEAYCGSHPGVEAVFVKESTTNGDFEVFKVGGISDEQ